VVCLHLALSRGLRRRGARISDDDLGGEPSPFLRDFNVSAHSGPPVAPLALLLFIIALAGCDEDTPVAAPQLEIGIHSDLAVAADSELLAAVGATHYGELSRGPNPENVFDLLIPSDGATSPRGLVLYTYGGGFASGGRLASFTNAGRAEDAEAYLDAGLAYATIDYRFRDGAGMRTLLQDAQLCMQYVRLHAETMGIDPDRVVLTGGLAGAGLSLWLGTSDDLPDASGGHAVLAVSTRVDGVILDQTPVTYDFVDWPTVVFAPEHEAILRLALDGGALDSDIEASYALPDVSADRTALEKDPAIIAFRETPTCWRTCRRQTRRSGRRP
jgi:hypothetical protein